jgi:hypothetical protein
LARLLGKALLAGILRGGVAMEGRQSLSVAVVFQGGGGSSMDGGKGGVLLKLGEDEGKVRHPRV